MNRIKMTEIYDKYKNIVYRTAFVYCRNTADAEDITQDVFLRRFRHIDFNSEEYEQAWLIRVTVNCCKDLLKSFRYRFCNVPLDDVDLTYETEEESRVFSAVMDLKPTYRGVIHLYYYMGYSVREIGAITNKSESAVQTQLYRARSQLKEVLGEDLSYENR